jgi:hypothetical protein
MFPATHRSSSGALNVFAASGLYTAIRLTFLCILYVDYIKPLNAELNPMCHLLILLGDLTFMDPCISNKMQRYTVYSYLETALRVSGGTRHPQHTQTCSKPSTIGVDSSKCVTNTRCCKYSCMRS